MLAGTGCTYYGPLATACHLDLVAFATRQKWSSLAGNERGQLIDDNSKSLALLLRWMSANVLVLNGRSVVKAFEESAQVTLTPERMHRWDLPRAGKAVAGFGYLGVIDEFAGVPLGREIVVAGFNHNLQSSFGVTGAAIHAISDWVGAIVKGRR